MSSIESFFTARSSDDALPTGVADVVRVPSGIVHPARAAAIGAVIGITAEDVSAIARYEAALVDGRVQRLAVVPSDDESLFELIAHEHSGVPALRRHLGDRADLLLDAVPVIPIESRPPVKSADPAVRVERTHPVTAAYDLLIRNVERLERLVALSGPEILIAAQNRAVQVAFDHLVAHVRKEEGAPSQPATPKPPLELAKPPTKWRSDGAYGLLFLDEKRLLIQTPKSTKIMRLRGGALIREVTIALPVRYYANERVVFADGVAYVFIKGGLQGVALLDVAKGTFDETLTEKRPVRVLTDGVMDDGAAVVWDPHAQTGTAVDLDTYGHVVASYSRDGVFGWVLGSGFHGAIVELGTAELFARTEDFPFRQRELDVLGLKGDVARAAPFAIDEEYRVTAIAVTADRRYRLLGPNGVVVEDDRPLFAVAFRPEAAAWSPDARRLAVLTRGTVVIIDTEAEPKITARYKP
jgi:hypothetical protein